MCNEAARRAALHLIRHDFSQVRIELTFPDGLPNLAATHSIRITDPAAMVMASSAATTARLNSCGGGGISSSPQGKLVR